MINVFYDHQIFSMQQYGGISRYFHEVARRVAENPDFTSTVVAPVYINKYLAAGDVTVWGKHLSAMGHANRGLRIANRVLESPMIRLGRPDLMHHTFYEPTRRHKAPKIQTVHDMIPERYPESFPLGDPTSANKRAAVNDADQVICVSENTRRDLIEFFDISPNKLTVIHHGFDLSPPVRQLSAEQPKAEKPYFLYVGNRVGYKNFNSLLKAYATSHQLRNNTRLVTFGGGRFNADEKTLIEKHGLRPGEDIVQRAGSDDELSRCYQNAVAFVYPSLYEGFGIPPLEAMNHDCPVLCSNNSSLPEVVGDAALTFDPAVVDDIRAVMEKVLGSSDQRRSLIAAGRLRLAKFSWDRCAEQTMQVYRALLPR